MRRFCFPLYIILLSGLLLCGCKGGRNAESLQSGDGIVDVFYLVSTDVVKEEDGEGRELYRATLSPEDSLAMGSEMNYVREHMFKEPFNFISPYYHQFTFDALSLPEEEFSMVYDAVVKEACWIFDQYIKNDNNGRHFILAGFSQGAMLVDEILKHMDDETFSRMDAAYMLGYRLSEEDLADPHIQAAQTDDDRSVTISFNTVLDEDGIWPLVTEGTATCINPVNWKTDSTPATFTFKDQSVTVSVDTDSHVLIADTDPTYFHEWMDSNPMFSSANVSDDCLHHWDLLFYGEDIYKNACLRAGLKPEE